MLCGISLQCGLTSRPRTLRTSPTRVGYAAYMAQAHDASYPENRLLAAWRRLGRSRWGRRVFGWRLAREVPYSGAIRPRVLEVQPGRATVALDDRRGLRNHLGSIHAIALANLGELASGLAMMAALPGHARAIVTRLEIEYLKKARGRLVAEGRAEVPNPVEGRLDLPVYAEIRDAAGDPVARLTVHWRLAPRDAR